MNKLFAVVIKILKGKNSGKLVTVKMMGKSENQIKNLILEQGMKPVLISEEW